MLKIRTFVTISGSTYDVAERDGVAFVTRWSDHDVQNYDGTPNGWPSGTVRQFSSVATREILGGTVLCMVGPDGPITTSLVRMASTPA